MGKRILAGIMALFLLISSGCGAAEVSDDGAVNPDLARGNKWLDSDLIGSVSEGDEIRPQDDFAASANKEWITTSGIRNRYFDQITMIVDEKKVALLDDDSLTGKGALELKKYASLAGDWEARNKDGVEPLRPYLEAIEDISDLNSLYSWITDPVKNPLGLGIVSVDMSSAGLRAYPDEYSVYYSQPDFSLGAPNNYVNLTNDYEAKEIADQKTTYILSRLGYGDEEIGKILKENYDMEKKLAKCIPPDNDDDDAELDMTDSYEDILAAAGSYPLDEYMRSRGYENIKHMLGEIRYLKKASKLCTEGNVQKMKSMFIVGYVLGTGRYLDREAYDKFKEIDKSRTTQEIPEYEDETAKENSILTGYIGDSALVAAMDELYLDKYIEPESADELIQMTKDIIDTYRTEIFPNEEWLSEDGKKKCLDKLDAIVLNVIYPDFSGVDYTDLNIVSKEDGGSFLEAEFESDRFLSRRLGEKAGGKYDRSLWFPFDTANSTTITNATYSPRNNSINIYAGILEDPAYHPGMSKEELLSGIGAIVGHEITHGFDTSGVRYDKNGMRDNWLPEEDQQAFNDKADNVASYYSKIEPYKASGSYDGDNVKAEATADMGGLRVTLKMASHIDGFDYDSYFRHYALLWAAQYSLRHEEYYFKDDEHPIGYLRVNIGLQQFDEFMDTYDIKSGDGMYLEEKKRISVW